MTFQNNLFGEMKKVLEYRRLDLLPNLTDLYCNLYILFCSYSNSNCNCKP